MALARLLQHLGVERVQALGAVHLADAVLASDWLAGVVRDAREGGARETDARIRVAITQPHVRAQTEHGPDYCSTCSEAIHDWVAWPCEVVREANRA